MPTVTAPKLGVDPPTVSTHFTNGSVLVNFTVRRSAAPGPAATSVPVICGSVSIVVYDPASVALCVNVMSSVSPTALYAGMVIATSWPTIGAGPTSIAALVSVAVRFPSAISLKFV